MGPSQPIHGSDFCGGQDPQIGHVQAVHKERLHSAPGLFYVRPLSLPDADDLLCGVAEETVPSKAHLRADTRNSEKVEGNEELLYDPFRVVITAG